MKAAPSGLELQTLLLLSLGWMIFYRKSGGYFVSRLLQSHRRLATKAKLRRPSEASFGAAAALAAVELSYPSRTCFLVSNLSTKGCAANLLRREAPWRKGDTRRTLGVCWLHVCFLFAQVFFDTTWRWLPACFEHWATSRWERGGVGFLIVPHIA